jgi:effector-binding domain-containing protein
MSGAADYYNIVFHGTEIFIQSKHKEKYSSRRTMYKVIVKTIECHVVNIDEESREEMNLLND